MDERMKIWLENDWWLYLMCGAAVASCLIQLLLLVVYKRSLNASERMRGTKLAWLRQMKTRYESGYEWNNRIRNVGLFVDKHMGRRKCMGVYLKTWEEISRVLYFTVPVAAGLGTLCALAYGMKAGQAALYPVFGTALSIMLRLVSAMTNLKEKQNLLRTNLCDYFENTLQGEARKRNRENVKGNDSVFRRAAQQEEIACTVQEPEKKKQSKDAAKQQRKIKKEQRRVDKLTRRMEKMQRRLGTAATTELHPGEDSARMKREQLKRKVDVTPAQEDRIISEVLKEFLA